MLPQQQHGRGHQAAAASPACAPAPPCDLFEELGVLLDLVARGGRYVLVSSTELASKGQ